MPVGRRFPEIPSARLSSLRWTGPRAPPNIRLPMRAAALRSIALGLLAVPGCSGGNGDAPIPTRLAAIEAEIFAPSCTFSSCHGATSPEQGMSLTSPAWSAIVGVSSTEVPEVVRVAPGDPERSYLWLKVSNASPLVGVRMPPDQPLPSSALDAIRGWIAAGAAND